MAPSCMVPRTFYVLYMDLKLMLRHLQHSCTSALLIHTQEEVGLGWKWNVTINDKACKYRHGLLPHLGWTRAHCV